MSRPAVTDQAVPSMRTAYWDILRGVAWTLGSRWGIRAIGLVSIMVMARLLTPADFGIVAMAAMVSGLLDTLSRVGIVMLVIREPDSSREFYDTAWTMQILQGAALAVMLLVVAPLASTYFSEPRVIPVMHVFAVTALVTGTVNIGMVLARKELDFAKDFRFQIYRRLVTFGVTIAVVIPLRSYWAIVIGQLVAQIVSVAQSYWMHSYRPRLCLRRVRDFLHFARSVIPYNVGLFFSGKADVLVVGRIAGTASLGLYNVASELTSTFTREVVGTIGRGLLPNYARLAPDRPRLAEAYLTVLAATASLAVALGIGIIAVAPEFVAVLLGEQWVSGVPVVQWLALYGTVVCILATMSGHIFIVLGKERLAAVLMWLRLGLFLPATIIAASIYREPTGVAIAAAFSAALSLPIAGYFLARSLEIRPMQLFSALWRPAIGATAMLFVTSSVPPWSDFIVAMLLTKTAIGGATYITTVVGLWLLAGSPQGPEKLIVDGLRTRTKRRRESSDPTS